MDYLAWNDRIAAAFFTPASEGRRVYLFVTKELIFKIGADESADLAAFTSALRRGPAWAPGYDICGNAEAAFHEWRREHFAYPPYVGYLAFFALAAGIEGDFADHAYYPRLRSLLGEHPVAGTYPGFHKMRTLWDDLEVWTQQDQQGRLGVFQADIASRFVHVGLPISQTILSETERQCLPAIFAAYGVDGQERPPDAVLTRVLIENTDDLRPRTRKIVLARSAHEEEFETLVEAVAEELASWDGSIPAVSDERPGGFLGGSARLWCEDLDRVSGTIEMRLVCRTSHEYPDDGLSLEISYQSGAYTCDEFRDGWSHALTSGSGEVFDASTVDWKPGLRLRETERNWRFTLPASPVRLFVDAAREGLSGYIETQGLTHGTPFLLLVRHEHQPLIENWGRASCKGFASVALRSGLPAGWLAYVAEAAFNDDIVGNLFPTLSMPHSARISFTGGLSAAPSTYFAFALPELVVTGVTPDAELFCNGTSLGLCAKGVFTLGEALAGDARLQFEVKDGARTVSRRSIYVEPGIIWPQSDVLAWSDGRGDETIETSPRRAAGASVYAGNVAPFVDWVPSDRAWKAPIPDGDNGDGTDDGGKPRASPPPPVTFTSESEIRRLIGPWRSGLKDGQLPECEISSRPGGSALNEGTVQYLLGSRGTHTARNWARAIRELTLARESVDPIVSTLAVALLQLSFYKSGRSDDAASLSRSVLPHGFGRLQLFMKLLADISEVADDLRNGIGIADISPLDADCELERRLFASIHAQPTEHTE